MPKRPVFPAQRNPLASRHIPSQSSSGLWIDQLMRLDTLGGMQIERYLEAFCAVPPETPAGRETMSCPRCSPSIPCGRAPSELTCQFMSITATLNGMPALSNRSMSERYSLAV